MKSIRIIILVSLIFILAIPANGAFAYETDVDSIINDLKEMPAEQRLVVAEQILAALAQLDGNSVLDEAYQTALESAETNDDADNTVGVEEESLEALLLAQPLAVVKTEFVKDTSGWSSDYFSAVLMNNSKDDIKSAVIAFVAWDKNNLPLKVRAEYSIFTGDRYAHEVEYDEVNLIPGSTSEDGYTFRMDNSDKIVSFKAIAVSYENFEGDVWENPYYDAFCEIYEGKKLKAD